MDYCPRSTSRECLSQQMKSSCNSKTIVWYFETRQATLQLPTWLIYSSNGVYASSNLTNDAAVMSDNDQFSKLISRRVSRQRRKAHDRFLLRCRRVDATSCRGFPRLSVFTNRSLVHVIRYRSHSRLQRSLLPPTGMECNEDE